MSYHRNIAKVDMNSHEPIVVQVFLRDVLSGAIVHVPVDRLSQSLQSLLPGCFMLFPDDTRPEPRMRTEARRNFHAVCSNVAIRIETNEHDGQVLAFGNACVDVLPDLHESLVLAAA